MSWLQFERVVARTYGLMGFSASLTADGADEGIDIILKERDNIILVQCKHWGAYSVGVNVVRELYGVMHSKNAEKSILVTSGRLTKAAKEFARNNRVHWVDEATLRQFIKPEAMPPQDQIAKDRNKLCPQCGEALSEKKNRKSGEKFLGCPRYPSCRGTRSMNQS